MTERELDSPCSVDMTLLCSVDLTSLAHSSGRTAVRLSCPDRWNESLAIVPANDGDFQQHAENRWLTYWPAVTILGSLPWTSLPPSHTLAKKCHIFDRGVALYCQNERFSVYLGHKTADSLPRCIARPADWNKTSDFVANLALLRRYSRHLAVSSGVISKNEC